MKIEGGEEGGCCQSLVSSGTISRTLAYSLALYAVLSRRIDGMVWSLILVSRRYSAYVTTMKCGRMRYLAGTSLSFQIDHGE